MTDSRPERIQRAADLDDPALARRVQAGCTVSFEILVGRYEDRLLRFLVQRVGHVQDAEDLLQETFVRVHRQIRSYDPTRRLAPWLFTIASRLAASHRRRPRRWRTGDDLTTAVDPRDPVAIVCEREENRRLWAAAGRRLSTDQFTALWLRYAQDLTVREIAGVMSKTQTNVKVLLFRARTTLADALSARAASRAAHGLRGASLRGARSAAVGGT